MGFETSAIQRGARAVEFDLFKTVGDEDGNFSERTDGDSIS